MPKVKETKVALKGQAALNAPRMSDTLRKAPPHSEEVQNSSDSDGSNSDSSSGHSSGSESDAEKRKNTKKPKPSKVKETEPNSPPVPDDSSDEESDSDADLDAAVAKANAQKKAPAAVTANGAALKTTKAAKPSKSSEKVSESDDSSDEEENDSDVEMAEAETEKPAAPVRVAGQAAASETTAAAVVPPQPFVPPPGYKALNTKSALAKTVNSLFDPSTISSKQIWHITAPSSVPLSQIKSVSLSAIQSHQTILSHNGTDYNLAEEPTNNARVLLPSSKSDAYTAVEIPVSKTLHLQQTIRLPNLSAYQTDPNTGSNAAASLRTPTISAPRPQPKGMRMRYKPPGFGDEDPGLIGSSEDESDANAKQVEKSAKEARSKRKRDEKEAETPKEKKRFRKAAEAAEKLAEGTLDEAPETAEEKARKKAEKKDKKKKDKK
ncbi:hypothetical protein E4T48_05827 [Aureobasidium sp. EXF-10727]|nr:hypothetical protein E4T48_05827 [Aureobasidium sp. EXF-10727]